MRVFFLFFMFLLVSQAPAESYNWVDAKGNVHYGAEPQGVGAKPMRQLPGLSTYSPPPLPSRKPVDEMERERAQEGEGGISRPPQPGYRELKIVSPENGGTVRSSPGEVPVFVALSPLLREGDYFRVLLDGQILPKRYSSTVIRLNNVDRGEHRIAVAVFSKEGSKLLQSDTHTFYLHRTIVRKREPR
jgi:hypothetical protein